MFEQVTYRITSKGKMMIKFEVIATCERCGADVPVRFYFNEITAWGVSVKFDGAFLEAPIGSMFFGDDDEKPCVLCNQCGVEYRELERKNRNKEREFLGKWSV